MVSRHHQHIRRIGQAAERIGRHLLPVQRHIGAHLAVILKIDAARIEDAHGFDDALRALGLGIAEGGEGQQRDARRVTEAPRHAGGFHRDIGELLGGRHLMHGGVSDQHGAAARQHQRHADDAMAGLGVDGAPHILQRDRVVARQAGDHRIGVAHRHHRGGEQVAVLVDHPQAVAEQETLPLQPLIQELRIDGIAPRHPRVVDFDAVAEVNAGLVGGGFDAVLAADQHGLAEALVHIRNRGADDGLLLALSEHDFLRPLADLLVDALQRAGDRVAAGGQVALVLLKIGDLAARRAGLHRGLGDGGGNPRDQPGVERHRDNVFRPEFRPGPLIGRGDLIRHVLSGQLGQRPDGGDFHFHVDLRRAHIQRAAEQVREAQHVIHLVGIVRAPRRHDRVITHFGDFLRGDFRIRVGHRENDRIFGHRADHILGDGALGRKAEENIGAVHRLRKRALVGFGGMGALPLVHAFLAALINNPLGVAEDDVLGREAQRLDQVKAGDAGGAGAVADQLRRLHVAAGQLQRVDDARRRDDRGAVLVIVEHRNIHQLLQPLLDDETFRRLDILQVDAAEGRAEKAHAVDEFVSVLGVDLKVDGIDVSEALEQHRLAFHHRLGGQRAEIAQAENGGAVGNHRDQVAARGVIKRRIRVFGDGQHRRGDAGRISQRQIALRRHRLGRNDLQLARLAARMEIQRLLIGDNRARGLFDVR